MLLQDAGQKIETVILFKYLF